MRPRFYAGKDDNQLIKLRRVLAASMRPRFYAGKDAIGGDEESAATRCFNEAPLLCGERRRLNIVPIKPRTVLQ